MARTKQKLIHLHSTTPLTVDRASAVNMAVGEIAVQAAAEKKDSSLWILTANSGDVVQFPSVEKVESLISGATSDNISTLRNDVDELKATVDGYSSTNTVKVAIEGVQNDLQGKIDTINGLIGDGFFSASTITSQLAAVKSTADAAKSTADTNTESITGIKSALDSLTTKNAVPKAIAAAKTKVARSTDDATTKFLTVSDNSADSPADGVTYTLTLTDVASAQGLSDLSKTVGTHTTQIAALQSLHAEGKTVAAEVADGIAKVVADAPADFDTLKEIAEWIANDQTDAASMSNDIAKLKATLTGYSSTSTVQSAISTVNTNITDINNKIGNGFDSANTVAKKVAAAKTTITTGETGGVKVEIVNTGVGDGHTNYKISSVGLATTGAVSDLSNKVDTLETSLTNEVTNRENADTAIKNQIGTGFTESYTVAKAVAAAKTKVAADTGTSTTNFLELSNNSGDTPASGVTYTIKLKDVASAQALDTLDKAAVKSGEINVDSQTFTGTFDSNKLTFNLSTLIIDCGEY